MPVENMTQIEGLNLEEQPVQNMTPVQPEREPSGRLADGIKLYNEALNTEDEDEKYRIGKELVDKYSDISEDIERYHNMPEEIIARQDIDPWGPEAIREGVDSLGQSVRRGLQVGVPFGAAALVDPEGAKEWAETKSKMSLPWRTFWELLGIGVDAKAIGALTGPALRLTSKLPTLGSNRAQKAKDAVAYFGRPVPSKTNQILTTTALDTLGDASRAYVEDRDVVKTSLITSGLSLVTNGLSVFASKMAADDIKRNVLAIDDAELKDFNEYWNRSADRLAELEERARKHLEIPVNRKGGQATKETFDDVVARDTQERGQQAVEAFQQKAFKGKADPLEVDITNKDVVPSMDPQKRTFTEMDEQRDQLILDILGDDSATAGRMADIDEQIDAIRKQELDEVGRSVEYKDAIESQAKRKEWYNKGRQEGTQKAGRIATADEIEADLYGKIETSDQQLGKFKETREKLEQQKKQVLLQSDEIPRDLKEIVKGVNFAMEGLEHSVKKNGGKVTLRAYKNYIQKVNNAIDMSADKLKGTGVKVYDYKNKIRNRFYEQVAGSSREAAIYSRFTQAKEFMRKAGNTGNPNEWLASFGETPYVNNIKLMGEISDPQVLEKYNKVLDILEGQGLKGTELINEFNNILNRAPINTPISKSLPDLKFNGDAMDMLHLNEMTKKMATNMKSFIDNKGLQNRMMVGAGIAGLGAVGTGAATALSGGDFQTSGLAGIATGSLVIAGLGGYRSLLRRVAKSPDMLKIFENPETVSLARKLAQKSIPQKSGSKLLRRQIVEDLERSGHRLGGLYTGMSESKIRKLLISSPARLAEFLKALTFEGAERAIKVGPSKVFAPREASELPEREESYKDLYSY